MSYPSLYVDPSFVFPSVARLSGPITINSQTVNPFFRYNGFAGTVASFPADGYGVAIPTAGAGDDPLIDQPSPLIGATDGSVEGQDGKSWQASLATTYDVTTEDLFFELLFKQNTIPAIVEYILAKWAAAAGYWASLNSSGQILLILRGPGGTYSAGSAVSSIAADTWYYAGIFADVSGSAQVYLMNASSGGAVPVSAAGSLSNANKFEILALAADGGTANLAHLAGYKSASGWLDSHLQPTFISQRCAQLLGNEAIKYNGTSTPANATRASTGTLVKVTSGTPRLYFLSNNWTPVDYDDSDFPWLHSHPAETNEILQSSTLATTWSANGTVVVTNNTAETTDPEGGNNASKVVGVATGANHLEQTLAAATFTNDAKLAISFWIKRISTSGLLEITNPEDDASPHDFGHWVIDMADLPDAWVRIDRSSEFIDGDEEFVEFIAAADGAAGMHFHRESGGGTLEFYIYNVQQIENGEYHTYCDIYPTLAAAVTRAADSIYWKGDDGNLGGVGSEKQGCVKFKVKCQYSSWAIQVAQTLLEISDGGASADRLNIQVNTSNYAQVVIDATGGTTRTAIGPATDIMDGSEHDIQISYRPGRVVVYVDGVAGTPITTAVIADIPDNLDRVTAGIHPIRKIECFRRPIWSGREFTR
jgi:hypothetical protein